VPASYPRQRPRGDGSLYQTPDGRWRGALVVRDPVTGASVRRYVSGRSRTAAARSLARLRDAAADGRGGRTPTLGAYLAGWLPTYRATVRFTTYRTVAGSVDRLLPLLGDVPLAELSPAAVTNALAALIREGLSPLRVRNIRGVLRRALADAERAGLVTRNAAALARPPKLPYHPIAYVPPADLPALLDALATRGAEGAPFVLAITTGLRAGELCGLRWEDVSGDTLTVHRAMTMAPGGWAVGETKSGRSRRTIVLPTRAQAALAALGSAVPGGPVLTGADGRPLTPQTLSRAWRGLRGELGLPTTRLHDLRHTAATAMLTGGVPLSTVSRVLGHAGVTITLSTYAEVVPELHRDAAAALDRVLGEGAT
jgi:integrase